MFACGEHNPIPGLLAPPSLPNFLCGSFKPVQSRKATTTILIGGTFRQCSLSFYFTCQLPIIKAPPHRRRLSPENCLTNARFPSAQAVQESADTICLPICLPHQRRDNSHLPSSTSLSLEGSKSFFFSFYSRAPTGERIWSTSRRFAPLRHLFKVQRCV